MYDSFGFQLFGSSQLMFPDSHSSGELVGNGPSTEDSGPQVKWASSHWPPLPADSCQSVAGHQPSAQFFQIKTFDNGCG